MLAALSAFFIVLNGSGGAETIGMMPEVVVTAPRYEGEDAPYSGLMPEIVVTAPRYTAEEIANSGMLPEVIVVAERGAWSISDLSLVRFIRRELSLGSWQRTYLVRFETQSQWFYN